MCIPRKKPCFGLSSPSWAGYALTHCWRCDECDPSVVRCAKWALGLCVTARGACDVCDVRRVTCHQLCRPTMTIMTMTMPLHSGSKGTWMATPKVVKWREKGGKVAGHYW